MDVVAADALLALARDGKARAAATPTTAPTRAHRLPRVDRDWLGATDT